MKRESAGDSIVSIVLPVSLIVGLVLLLSLGAEQTSSEAVSETPLESWLKILVDYLAAGAELAGAVVVGVAVFRGIFTYIRQLFSRSKQHYDATESIRLKLGRVLTLGLEFTVASDILRTAIAPTRRDILNLGEIVLLRTLLNYFLEREIQQVEQKRANNTDD